MRLTKNTIDKVLNSRIKAKLALMEDKSIYTIQRWIEENRVNGPLTKLGILDMISQESGAPLEKLVEKL